MRSLAPGCPGCLRRAHDGRCLSGVQLMPPPRRRACAAGPCSRPRPSALVVRAVDDERAAGAHGLHQVELGHAARQVRHDAARRGSFAQLTPSWATLSLLGLVQMRTSGPSEGVAKVSVQHARPEARR